METTDIVSVSSVRFGHRVTGAVAVGLIALLLGCSSSDNGATDAAPDAGVDATADAKIDATTDTEPDGTSADTGPVTHNEMLDNLGIDTSLGDPSDPQGNPLPKDYHPFSRPHTTFMPRKEIFLAGFNKTGAAAPCAGKSQCLYEDSTASYAAIFATTDDSWTSATYKNVIGADVDGDGRDEIVVVFYADTDKKLKLKVIDKDASGYKEYDTVIDPAVSGVPGGAYPYHHPSLAAGDLDKDGRDEIVVGFNNVYVVDDKAGNYTYTTTTKDYSTYIEVFVAAGDLDGDGQDELAVTYQNESTMYAYLDVFDGDLSATQLKNGYQLHSPNNGHTYAGYVRVAIGDIDGDKLGEIVFHGISRDFTAVTWAIAVMDDAVNNLAWLDAFYCSFRDNPLYPPPFNPTLELLDYNGDGDKEIFASLSILDYKKGGTGYPSVCGGTSVDLEGTLLGTEAPFAVASGDVDDDGKDELLFYLSSILFVGGRDDTGKWAVDESWPGTWSLHCKICTANVDDDSPTVEYAGHELQFSDPQVIAVMAAPPLHSGIGQNEGDSSTSFGTSTGSGVETTKSMGISVGFSVGFEAEAPFNLAKVSFKTNVEMAMDMTSSQSLTVEKYITYTGGFDEDKVVFTAVPFDVYYYKILTSPVASEVGKMLTVNVPREMQTLSVERGFYNDNNGDGDDIDSTVLKHTIGDPKTYPSVADRDALIKSGGFHSIESPVGVGSGSVTVGINVIKEQTTGTAFDFGVSIEAEMGAVGITMGMSAGFHYGYALDVTNTDSTVFEGTVGDIPQQSYNTSSAYSFGLFTYPFVHGSQKFTVVNYWVK